MNSYKVNAGNRSVSDTNCSSIFARRFGVLGDSISAQARILPTSTLNGWTVNGYLTWVRRYLADAIDLPTSRIYAVPSATVGGSQPNNVLADQLPLALADDIEAAIIHMGTNSVGSDTTANLIEQFKAVYDPLIANGTFIFAIPIRVRGAAAQWNTNAKIQQAQALNRFIRDYCMQNARSMLCIDVNAALTDFSTGLVRSGYFLDALHDNSLSAQVMGKLVADAMRPYLAPMDAKILHPLDVYHATDNPGGNLIANGFFNGNGGNPSINGATGVAADGWDVGRNNGGSTVTVTASKAADPTLVGVSNQVVTFGGTADSSTSFLAYFFNDVSNFAVGDRCYFEVEVTGAMTTANLGNIAGQLNVFDSSYQSLFTSYDGLYQSSGGPMPTALGTFTLRTEPFALPAGFSYLSGQVLFQAGSSGSIAGSMKFSRAAIRKIL